MNRLSRTLSPSRRSAGRGEGAASGYDAFISYSHGADLEFAPSLQRGLRSLAKPWNRRYALRVFLDQTSLAGSADLKSDLDGPIARSEFFILLASAEAAGSPWVGKEVSYWLDNKEMSKFLIAKTDGEISWDEATNDFDWETTTALPRSLAKAFPSEPNFVDFSAEHWHSGVSFRDPQFKTAVARLAAPIHGKELDELVGEDIKQQRRTKRLVRSAVATLVVLLIAASAAAVYAYQQRNTAREQLAKATSLALTSISERQDAEHYDYSLILSLAAYRSSPTAQARSSMISALEAAQSSGTPSGIVRFDKEVDGVAFSPDGSTLAVASGADGTMELRDARTHSRIGRPLRVPVDPNEGNAFVAFSPAGGKLATAGPRGTVQLWDADTAQMTKSGRPLGDGKDVVRGVAFSPDDSMLATAGTRIRLWDVGTHRQLGHSPLSGDFGDVAFSPDGSTLATVREIGVAKGWAPWSEIQFWRIRTDAKTGEPVLTRLGGPVDALGFVGGVAFSPDGGTIATGHMDGVVRLWDRADLRGPRSTLKGHTGTVGGVAFSRDGILASASRDGTVRLWDVRPGSGVGQTLRGSAGPPACNLDDCKPGSVGPIAFSPDGKLAVTAAADGTVRLWDVRPDTRPGRLRCICAPFGTALRSEIGPIRTIAFSPDSRTVATASSRGVQLWSLNERELAKLGEPLVARWVTELAFTPDGSTLTTVSQKFGDGVCDSATVRRWDVRDVDRITELGKPGSPDAFSEQCLSLSPAGGTIAIASASDSDYAAVQLWSVSERITKLGNPVRFGMAFSGTEDKLAFSPDETTLAVSLYDGTIFLADVHTQTLRGQPMNGTAATDGNDPPRVDYLAFSHDGRMLASVEDTGTVRLWDVSTQIELGKPQRLQAGSVVFTPDAGTLATVDRSNGTVRLWEGILWRDPDQLMAEVCNLVGNLPEDGWKKLAPGLAYQTPCPK